MDITARQDAWLQQVASAAGSAGLTALESRLFGPKGEVLELVRSVTSLPKEERPAFGKAANAVKQLVEAALNQRRASVEAEELDRELQASDFDPTERGPRERR